MFNLGGHLRQRYYKLLPPNGIYTKENMNVISSAAERCLMSASSFMAGFMPPLEQRNKLPIAWQPVPITSMPRNLDYVSVHIAYCYLILLRFSFVVDSTKKALSKVR